MKQTRFWMGRRLWLSLIVAGIGVTGLSVASAQAVEYQPLNNKRPKDFAIIREGAVWHVFSIYCTIGNPSCQDPYPGLMHLTSTDLKTWTEVGYVVPPGPAGSWDDKQIWAPSVVKHNGIFYMFYAGVGANASGIWEQHIGLATSTDLMTWTKHPGNPVVDCDDFSWAYWDSTDSLGVECRDPFVIWDDTQSQWVMFLNARSANDTVPLTHPATVGIATSNDLISWNESGYLPNTNWWKAESPHVFRRDGLYYLFWTDDCSSGKCLKYATSTNLYGGYAGRTNPPMVGFTEYASEYVIDHGREYFARVANFNYRLDFDEIIWPAGSFGVREVSYGSLGDYVWDDADQSATSDAVEIGINGVVSGLYLDDGDGMFEPGSGDWLYRSVTSGDNPGLAGVQTGFYKFGFVIPGTYWVRIEPSNYLPAGPLFGMETSTNNTTVLVTIGSYQNVTTHDIGLYVPPPPDPPYYCRPISLRYPWGPMICFYEVW